MLIEDFGNDRMRDWLDDNAATREEDVYARAIDALVALAPPPAGAVRAVRHGRCTSARQALFTEWYCPAMRLAVDAEG